MKRLYLLIAGVVVVGSALFLLWQGGWQDGQADVHRWSEGELAAIRSLSLTSLPPLPPDPSNRVGDDLQAAALGHRLFFDSRLSGPGTVSCATCHQPDRYFTDGLPLAQALGTAPRHTPTIVGVAYQPWFYWDGRKDSQWSQALAPLEAAVEHGMDRTRLARLMAEVYADEYAALFGPLPDLSGLPPRAGPSEDDEIRGAWEGMSEAEQGMVNEIFANVGKALAAYQRQFLPGQTRFDDYAQAAVQGDLTRMGELFTPEEAAGLRLFIGRANCLECHNGPLFSNGDFHNIGLPLEGTTIEAGRVQAVAALLADPFNCLGAYSDAGPEDCGELRFVKQQGEELIGAFKTPSLRNVGQTAPYMHRGQFPDLDRVLTHYNAAPPAFPGHSDLVPLLLNSDELGQLKAFLLTLNGGPDAPPELLQAPDG